MLINLKRKPKIIEKNVQRCREKGITLPTFAQMKDPSLIPQDIKDKLKKVGLWDVNPLNLYRINWHNEPVEKGGLFGDVNYIEIPREITGTKAHIYALCGKYFPCGVHKVGATYACLAPALVSGNFDAVEQQAVWPSTGNYCRGGAYNSALLGCKSIAILPENMSQERFNWLKTVAGEIIATPGCESNVKEIFDKCHDQLSWKSLRSLALKLITFVAMLPLQVLVEHLQLETISRRSIQILRLLQERLYSVQPYFATALVLTALKVLAISMYHGFTMSKIQIWYVLLMTRIVWISIVSSTKKTDRII